MDNINVKEMIYVMSLLNNTKTPHYVFLDLNDILDVLKTQYTFNHKDSIYMIIFQNGEQMPVVFDEYNLDKWNKFHIDNTSK